MTNPLVNVALLAAAFVVVFLVVMAVWRAAGVVPWVVRIVLCEGLAWHAPPRQIVTTRDDGRRTHGYCPWCHRMGTLDDKVWAGWKPYAEDEPWHGDGPGGTARCS